MFGDRGISFSVNVTLVMDTVINPNSVVRKAEVGQSFGRQALILQAFELSLVPLHVDNWLCQSLIGRC